MRVKSCWQSPRTSSPSKAPRYDKKGQPITITATTDEKALIVKVRNSGKPIPSDSLKSIFNPLVQLSRNAPTPADERPATSLGLGLYIAREITEAHGGTIEVESTEVQGTTFIVMLPKDLAGTKINRKQ